MTVEELIEKLKQYPPKLKVFVATLNDEDSYGLSYGYSSIIEISIEGKNNNIYNVSKSSNEKYLTIKGKELMW